MYRFHMPLFLILSGCFLKKVEDVETYAKMKATRLLTPYLIYMAIDFLIFDHLHSFNRIIHYLYGGRFINGVYWYITSLYISLCLEYVGSVTIPIMFLHEPLNRFCPMSNYLLIYLLIGMGIPVVFSIAVSRFEYCKYFGIPKRKIAKRYRC